ncbi:single-strand DNA endonuclease ASTE1-like [Diretmus argenteus]
MGVKGLSSFVQKNSLIYRDIRFRNNKLVIDGNNLIYLLYFRSGLDRRHGGEYGAFEDLIEKFIKSLRNCRVEPYVVLDGGLDPTDKKLETLKKRTKNRIQKAQNKVMGQQKKVLPPLGKLVFIQTLARLKVPMAQCFGEADIHIASLASEWGCPVLSDDSDFYIFDLPGGLLPISHFQWEVVVQDGIPCKHYTTSSFCIFFNIQRQILPVFAALAGNDYVNLREMGVYPSWADFAPAGSGKTARLEGLLRWLRGFQRPQDALNAALGLMGKLSRKKKAGVLQGLTLGMNKYQLPPTDLRCFFTKGTVPVLTEEMDLVPDWARLALIQGRMGGDFLNVLLLKRMELSFPVDDSSKPSANLTSRPIRQVMYGLLLGCRFLVKEWDRVDLQLVVYPVQPVLRGAALQLKLEALDKADRPLVLRVLLETLAVKQEVLDGVPAHLHLPVAVTCYWLQKARPPPDLRLLQALLLGMVTGTRASYFDFSVSFNQLHLKVGWCVFHINCEGITKQFKSRFLDIKVGKSPAKLSAEYTEFFSKLLYQGTLAHQLFHRLESEVNPELLLSDALQDRTLYRTLLVAVLQSRPQQTTPSSGPRRGGAPPQQPLHDLTAKLKQVYLLDEEDEEEEEAAVGGKSAVRADGGPSWEMVSVKTRFRTKVRNHLPKMPEFARKQERICWD